jgi:hypothetical protein
MEFAGETDGGSSAGRELINSAALSGFSSTPAAAGTQTLLMQTGGLTPDALCFQSSYRYVKPIIFRPGNKIRILPEYVNNRNLITRALSHIITDAPKRV